MGRVERLLLNFCKNRAWTSEDQMTRKRIIMKKPMEPSDQKILDQKLLSDNLCRCFYRRRPHAMREASVWSRTAEGLLRQFEAEDAAKAAADAIEGVLNGAL
ncbi:MAG: hypothetical protein KGN32_16925 [Burkholderiales bacterium]|nr:hypothetical protein [Burkholderiales bacterium]